MEKHSSRPFSDGCFFKLIILENQNVLVIIFVVNKVFLVIHMHAFVSFDVDLSVSTTFIPCN